MFLGIGCQHLGWGMNEGILRWEERILFHRILLVIPLGRGSESEGKPQENVFMQVEMRVLCWIWRIRGQSNICSYPFCFWPKWPVESQGVPGPSGLWIPREFQIELGAGRKQGRGKSKLVVEDSCDLLEMGAGVKGVCSRCSAVELELRLDTEFGGTQRGWISKVSLPVSLIRVKFVQNI